MASTDLIRAAVETGYLTNLYNSSHHADLTAAIDQVSNDTAKQIFGTASKVEINEWLAWAHSPANTWLFSFVSIREKVHLLADVEMHHVNKEEAKRLIERLKRQQQQMKEKALEEEKQVQQKEQAILGFLQPQSQRMNEIKMQLQNPQNYMPNEKFTANTKYAIIHCN